MPKRLLMVYDRNADRKEIQKNLNSFALMKNGKTLGDILWNDSKVYDSQFSAEKGVDDDKSMRNIAVLYKSFPVEKAHQNQKVMVLKEITDRLKKEYLRNTSDRNLYWKWQKAQEEYDFELIGERSRIKSEEAVVKWLLKIEI